MKPVIDRSFIGKAYRPFTATISEELCREFRDLFLQVGATIPLPLRPPLNWPSLVTLHGAACLIPLWEDMGVDPLDARLVGEQFVHHRRVSLDETVTGELSVSDITEHAGTDGTLAEDVDLEVVFRDSAGALVSVYRLRFRIEIGGSSQATELGRAEVLEVE
jgi:hypothetical protein